jgi:hypothetical protein
MAVYKCIQSGNTVTFDLQHDIESMKGHQGYVRIDEPEEQSDPVRSDTGFSTNIVQPKKMGRPRKMANVN